MAQKKGTYKKAFILLILLANALVTTIQMVVVPAAVLIVTENIINMEATGCPIIKFTFLIYPFLSPLQLLFSTRNLGLDITLQKNYVLML